MKKVQEVSHLLYGGIGLINYPVGNFDGNMWYNVTWSSHKSFPADFDFTVAFSELDLEFKDSDFTDMRDTPFDEALRPLCDWLASRPQNELIGNLNAIVDNLNEFGTDYIIELKTIS